MGNSGSVHNIAHLDGGPMSAAPWMEPAGMRDRDRDPYHQLIKVLPDVSNEPRLRPTSNGNILHGGGTISGRREPPFGVYRSKSIHQMHRSQTQLNLRETQHVLRRQSSEINFKRSGSEPDLRVNPSNGNAVVMQDKVDSKTSHRAKIMRGKKKKAAPPPPIQQQRGLMNGPIPKDYDPSRFGWKPPMQPKPPKPLTPPSKEARKLRLFKTKAESKRPSSTLHSELSDLGHKSDRSVMSGHSVPNGKHSHNVPPNVKPTKEPTTRWQEAKNKFFPLTQFRREKSFDISLLNANQKRQQQRVVDITLHQPSTPSAIKKRPMDDRPVRYSAIESKVRLKKLTQPQQVMENERRSYGSGDEERANGSKPDFHAELESATRRRSANLDNFQLKPNRKCESPSPASSSLSTQSRPIPRVRTSNDAAPPKIIANTNVDRVVDSISKPVFDKSPDIKPNKPEPVDIKTNPIEIKAIQNKPKIEKSNGIDTTDDPKIVAEHTKTFYFGMDDGYDDKVKSNNVKEDSALEAIQIDAIDKFAETLHQNLKQTAKKHNFSDSSESVLSSVVFDEEFTPRLNNHTDDSQRHDRNRASDSDGGHIQVLHLRPTLPRRQFDIPRFSPAAAWRTLETQLDGSPKTDVNEKASGIAAASNTRNEDLTHLPSPEEPRRQLEERIQRIYREPVPGFSDNKSGDSGISGDAGLPDLTRPYRQRQQENVADDETENKVGPFLSPWTPQQDLNDDSSSDGGAVDVNGTIDPKDEPAKFSNCGHIFSLSLPRESHFATYGDPISDSYYAPKLAFNSLQKSKPALANIFGIEENVSPPETKLSVFRSDNWLLSRSAPNSIDNFHMLSSGNAKVINEETESFKQTSRRENRQPSPSDYMTTLHTDIQPPSFNYITSGRHMMYLPKNAVNSEAEQGFSNNMDGELPEHIRKTIERKYSPQRSSRNDLSDFGDTVDGNKSNVSIR